LRVHADPGAGFDIVIQGLVERRLQIRDRIGVKAGTIGDAGYPSKKGSSSAS
jgi:hypothetical protein